MQLATAMYSVELGLLWRGVGRRRRSRGDRLCFVWCAFQSRFVLDSYHGSSAIGSSNKQVCLWQTAKIKQWKNVNSVRPSV